MCYLPEAVCIHDHEVTLPERLEMMKRAAHSAHIYESLFPDRGPLYSQYNRSLGWYRSKAWLSLMLFRLFGVEWARGDFYDKTLAQAFVEEYERTSAPSSVPSRAA